MKLIDVTNNYSELVMQQLENTDAYFIKVYTIGNTTVIYTEAEEHIEIVLINKKRNVKNNEVREILRNLIDQAAKITEFDVIYLDNIVEISIPVKKIAKKLSERREQLQ